MVTVGLMHIWELNSTGFLHIYRHGDMFNWNYYSMLWYDSLDTIRFVIIESSVVSIGKYAFYGCKELTSITMPESVIFLRENAFAMCEKLKSVIIPDSTSLSSIRSNAFYGCKELTSITIPESVKYIGDYAFEDCSELKSVTLGSDYSVEMFRSVFPVDVVTDVTIGTSVTLIGANAFQSE